MKAVTLTLPLRVAFLLCAVGAACAQQPLATVSTADARVLGTMDVSGSTVRVLTSASITAYDHTAPIALTRGGSVALCTTSDFHLLRSGSGDGLQFALDRGAMEIRTPASSKQDAVLTPDLRFTLLTGGPLDLRVRVARNGDTCVENRGDTAPVLQVVETFGDAVYHLTPNQHVLFEHGSLREVVDRETSSCGCPVATPAMTAVKSRNATSDVTPQQSAALHPFPEAQAAGLTDAPSTLVGKTPANAEIAYGSQPSIPVAPVLVAPVAAQRETAKDAPQVVQPTVQPAAPPPAPPGAKDIVHVIGRFFKRLFRQHPE